MVLVGISGTVTRAQNGPISSGTGFFINEAGWAVTSAHVIGGCGSIEIKGYGTVDKTFSDDENDIAVVHVTSGGLTEPLLFRPNNVRLGDDVLTLGFPLSGLLSDSVKLTTGNISSLQGIGDDPRLFQVSVPIQPGNSGGPLVDMAGRVVGVMEATLAKKVSDDLGFNTQNVNFALKASEVVKFLTSNNVLHKIDNNPGILLSTADVAEMVARSTIQIICYGRLNESARNTPTNPSNPEVRRSSLVIANGYDAIGFDYSFLQNMSYVACKAACAQDGRCLALTFNKRYGACFLKNDVVAMVRNSDAISAYVAWKAGDILFTDFTVRANTDSRGGDYARLRNSGFVQCFVECATDRRCRAFAYVRDKHDCWLKDRFLGIQNKNGVELGIK